MSRTDTASLVIGATPALLTFRADGVPAGISEEDHAAGMASSLANLAAFTAQ